MGPGLGVGGKPNYETLIHGSNSNSLLSLDHLGARTPVPAGDRNSSQNPSGASQLLTRKRGEEIVTRGLHAKNAEGLSTFSDFRHLRQEHQRAWLS